MITDIFLPTGLYYKPVFKLISSWRDDVWRGPFKDNREILEDANKRYPENHIEYLVVVSLDAVEQDLLYMRCPQCSRLAASQTTRQEFMYGIGTEAVILSANFPIGTCCGLNFTDEKGEEARTAAVEQYLKGKKLKKQQVK